MTHDQTLLHQVCNALGLTNGDVQNLETLQTAARWALADESCELKVYEVVALQPVLATLKEKETKFFIPPKSLSIDKGALMPVEKEELIWDVSGIKKRLEDLRNIQPEKLLTALEFHASTLAVNETYNDLSLFDFIKMTTGIATCLQKSEKLRLAGGSISGIQTYLYDIVSKNTAKLLKGRSFYLQLLADSLLEELLQEFDLSPCNVVYASGGGFFVLLPDVPDIETRFREFSKEIAGQIYERHNTALFAELAITDAFDAAQPVNEIWDGLYKKLDTLKFQRLNGNDKLMEYFFAEAVEVGGIRERDPVTSEEMEEEEKVTHYGVKMLKTTKKQIELGKNLRSAKFWAIGKNGNSKAFKDPFGTFHYLVEEESEIPRNAFSRTFNQPNAASPFTFYGGHDFPMFEKDEIDEARQEYHYKGEVKPFDYLVGDDPLKRLAILRMDVDGLGAIFSKGIAKIPENRYQINFTRYAAVSRSLDFFFKGYLNTLQKEYPCTIIIYSGGDDLFIAGKWNEVLALAQDIHKAFDQCYADIGCRHFERCSLASSPLQ